MWALCAANDLKEFIALANRSDPPLFYASIGNGSLHHLAMEMLKQEAGIKLTHVPYRGGGPAGGGGGGGGVPRDSHGQGPAKWGDSRGRAARGRRNGASCPASQNSIRTTKPQSGRGYSLPPARRGISSTRCAKK